MFKLPYIKELCPSTITENSCTSREHGYLLEWTQERWENAEIELAHARLVRARQQYQAMERTAVEERIEEDVYEDDEPLDWG